jgi:hypothetical protein
MKRVFYPARVDRDNEFSNADPYGMQMVADHLDAMTDSLSPGCRTPSAIATGTSIH